MRERVCAMVGEEVASKLRMGTFHSIFRVYFGGARRVDKLRATLLSTTPIVNRLSAVS